MKTSSCSYRSGLGKPRAMPLAAGGLLLLAAVLWSSAARAQQPAPPPPGSSAESREATADGDSESLWDIMLSLGLTGLTIVVVLVALSIVALALTLEHVLTIRAAVLLPGDLAEQFRQQLVTGGPAAADQACRARPSLLASVLRAGLAEWDSGWASVEKAAEDAVAQHAARLFRKIEYLSVIGNIAPMIGLLGTVTGMVFAFQEVAETQGAARAAQLAEGIYTALITTVGGLLVAIPALAASAVFRNRADQFVADAATLAQYALAPLKRARRTTTAPAPAQASRGS